MPKKIPNSKIMQHFFKLPEEQRIRILRQNLSEDYIETQAGNQFYRPMCALREMPEKEAKAYLKKYFGDTKEHLKSTIAHGEMLLGSFKDAEYTKLLAQTDEEKLYAQVCSETLSNRLRIFYEDLYEKDKDPYREKALKKIDNMKSAAYTLEDPASYAPGKSPKSFLEEVKKTMDLSKEPSLMEYLRAGIPEDDPERNEKLHCIAQQYMIFAESRLDPEELTKKFQDKDWKKNFNLQKILKSEDQGSRIPSTKVLPRIKAAVNDIPETEEEKAMFKEEALQVCRDYIAFKKISPITDSPSDKEFLKYTNDLQEELAAEGLKKGEVQELCGDLAKEYTTLQKEKSGWFLSKTNSPEYDNMMKHLKLFNAKLDLINGQQPGNLTPEELKTVQETNADVLLANAKQGCYNYGSIKVKNGTGSIWHDAGSERFEASMKTLSQLGEIGKKLHLSDSATAVRDEAQLQVLKNRRDGEWLKNNIGDAVAKTICAQVLLNKKTPAYQQNAQLEGDALAAQVEKIKSNSRFQTMMKTAKPEQLADALIEGGNSLYEVYNKADRIAKNEGHERTVSEIEPEALRQEKRMGGLEPGYH